MGVAKNHETFRTVSGYSTVPLGTAGTGTVIRHPTQTNILFGSGTQFTVDFKTVFQLFKQNIWIYCDTAHKVFRVTGVLSDTYLVVQGDVTTIGVAQTFTYILGDLISYGISPTAAAGIVTIDGVAFPAGDTYYQQPLIYTPHMNPRFLDAVVVFGDLSISETR